MRWRLFQVGGTAVWLHPAALMVAMYMIAAGFGTLLAVGTVSILLHESAHALMSACFGKPPEDIEITPLGALMRLDDDESFASMRRLLVLMAGPCMTLALCYLALFLTQAGRLPWEVGRQLFLCNAAMLFINLLPALPLDGGRAAAWLLSAIMPRETARMVMRAIGTALGLGCVGLNLWLSWRGGGWNLSLAAAGCFLMYSASRTTMSCAMAELRDFMDRKNILESRGTMSCRWVALSDEATLRQAVRCLHPRRYTMFCVSGNALTEQEIMAAYLDDPTRVIGDMAGKR